MNALRGVRRVLAWVAAAALVILAIAGGGGALGGGRDEVRFFVDRLPSSVDPLGSDDPETVAQLFERLTDIDATSRVVPALAESWAIDPGARRIVFTLRPDLRFSDGRPLTASDVVDSWLRLLDRGTAYSWLLSDVQGAVAHQKGSTEPVGLAATDPTHVEVLLAHPANDFPAIAASPWLGVTPAAAAPGVQRRNAAQIPVSGAYRVESWSQDELVLVRNPLYWAGPAPIGRVRFMATLGDLGRVKAFQEHRIDYTRIGAADAAWAATDATLGRQLITEPVPSVAVYGFSAQRPPFDDARVRRAFAEAIDWKRVVSVAGYPVVPATGMIPPGVPGRPRGDYSPRFDPVEARSLLSAAGYPGGVGFPAVRMTSPGFPWDPLVVADWRSELGVVVEAEEAFDLDYPYRLQTDPPDIWSAYWDIDYPAPNDFLGVPAGLGQVNNYSRWSSVEFEAAIESARAAPDAAGGRAAFGEAEAILRQEVPIFAVAYAPPEWALARSGLTGEGANGMGLIRLAGLAWSA